MLEQLGCWTATLFEFFLQILSGAAKVFFVFIDAADGVVRKFLKMFSMECLRSCKMLGGRLWWWPDLLQSLLEGLLEWFMFMLLYLLYNLCIIWRRKSVCFCHILSLRTESRVYLKWILSEMRQILERLCPSCGLSHSYLGYIWASACLTGFWLVLATILHIGHKFF